jgi:primosomal protein N' (replication factor Y)
VLALDRELDYSIPVRMAGRVDVGSVVRVPLHGRKVRGFVTALRDEARIASPASISALVSKEPLFAQAELDLARWAADRYVVSMGSVLHRAVPGRFSAPSAPRAKPRPQPPVARPAWLARADGLDRVVDSGRRAIVITPTAAQAAEAVAYASQRAAESGRGTLVISPRVELAGRIAAAVGGSALLHGDLPPSLRAKAWARARDGCARTLVGGRAALFAPLPNLGLVVVLGSHDDALKDERSPRLHALRVAMHRASSAGAAFMALGPAPPMELATSCEVLAPVRASRTARPEVVAPRPGPLTARLVDAVSEAIARGADALVFCARRGLALRVRCRDCGWYPRCDRCGLGLVLGDAEGSRELRCRGCARRQRVPSRCADCGSDKLDGVGWGSERIAAGLRGAGVKPVLRADAASPLPADRPRPAAIVGTRAALESLHGGLVGAVCVADLDQLLGRADFRAAERAFQTMCDLAGALEPGGRFIVQTREPSSHAVQAFTRGSWTWFAQRELELRKAGGWPPYGFVVRVDLPSRDVADALSKAVGRDTRLVGPLGRPGGSWSLMLRGKRLAEITPRLREFALAHPGVRIDVDPVDVS